MHQSPCVKFVPRKPEWSQAAAKPQDVMSILVAKSASLVLYKLWYMIGSIFQKVFQDLHQIEANFNKWCKFHQKMLAESKNFGKFVSFGWEFHWKLGQLVYEWVTFLHKIGICLGLLLNSQRLALPKSNLNTPTKWSNLVLCFMSLMVLSSSCLCISYIAKLKSWIVGKKKINLQAFWEGNGWHFTPLFIPQCAILR